MFGATTTIIDETQNVKRAMDRTAYRNLGHAAASIRKEAIASIGKSPKPSEPGTPPHTRGKPQGFKRGILYAVESPEMAVVGTAFSRVGVGGEPHEHGAMRGGVLFPERPFMFPAMESNLDRFAKGWEGTLG